MNADEQRSAIAPLTAIGLVRLLALPVVHCAGSLPSLVSELRESPGYFFDGLGSDLALQARLARASALGLTLTGSRYTEDLPLLLK